jgi:hypothetical protein
VVTISNVYIILQPENGTRGMVGEEVGNRVVREAPVVVVEDPLGADDKKIETYHFIFSNEIINGERNG